MRDLKEEIEAARATVAHCRIRAERPSSRLEDDFALEKARNRLLTLELRQLKLGQEPRQKTPKDKSGFGRGRAGQNSRQAGIGTKGDQRPRSARDRAEEAFASLNKRQTGKQEAV